MQNYLYELTRHENLFVLKSIKTELR